MFIKPYSSVKKSDYLVNQVDPLLKRERFETILRNAKKSEIIALKRSKLKFGTEIDKQMQKQQCDRNGEVNLNNHQSKDVLKESQ